jgi:hypothetical protein
MSDTVVVALRELCAYRSGVKGDLINVALFAYTQEVHDLIVREVTAERVATHMASLVRGDVTRYEVPNVLGLNFVMHEALGGGGPRSLRADNLGKTYGGHLVRLEIQAPAALVDANRRPRPDTAWAREILRDLPQA